MSAKDDQFSDRLLRFLKTQRGRSDVPVTSTRIIALAKEGGVLTNDAEIRQAIHALRVAGEPIASSATSPAGYLFAYYKDELEHTRADLLSRESEIRKAREAIERALCALPERPPKIFESFVLQPAGKEAT